MAVAKAEGEQAAGRRGAETTLSSPPCWLTGVCLRTFPEAGVTIWKVPSSGRLQKLGCPASVCRAAER